MAAMGATDAAVGLTKAAGAMESFIASITPLQAMLGVGLAIAIGVVTDKLVTAKDAGEQFAASLQSAVMSASNVNGFQTILNNINQLNTAMNNGSILKQEQANWNNLGMTVNSFSADARATGSAVASSFKDFLNGNIAGAVSKSASVFKDLFVPGAGAATQAAREMTAPWSSSARILSTSARARLISPTTYKTTLIGALALADLANVKLAQGITGTSQPPDRPYADCQPGPGL